MSPSESPAALLVPMLDFAREFEDETNLWFDSDHVPERLSCDGIEFCERFQLTDVEPIGWNPGQRWMKYLNFYTLRSLDVLESEAYALQRDMNDGRGTAWRQLREERSRAVVRPSPMRSLRTSWTRRERTWSAPVVEQQGARVILVALRPHGGDRDQDANAYLDERLIPELLHLAGVLGVERYQAAGSLAAAGPRLGQATQPEYMDIVELATPEVATSGAYRRFVGSLDVAPAIRAALTPVGTGVYQQRPSPWRLSVR